MGKIVTWSTPKYSESQTAHQTDSLFYAEDVLRYLKFTTPFSIKFCLRDALRYVVSDQKVVVPPGGFFLTNSGTEMECLPNKPGIQALIVFFTDELIHDVYRNGIHSDRSLLNDPSPKAQPPGFFEHVFRPPNPLSGKLTALARQISGSGTSMHDLLPDTFYDLAEVLLAQQQRISGQMDRVNARSGATREELFRRVLRAREYMLDNWNGELTLAQIARQACISPYHFHRTFREAFGQSPMKWLRQYKLERAEELLQGGRVSVTEAALRCGFSDVFTFSKAFKRARGYSPSGLIAERHFQ